MDPFALVLRPNELGDLADVSPFVRNTWESLRILRWKAVRYYSGQIFMEPVAQEVGEAGGPLLYPVGINLIKMIVQAMTDATFGEWDDARSVLMWKTQSSKPITAVETAAVEYVTRLMEDSNAASMFWELEFDRNLQGAGVLRVVPDLSRRSHLRWIKIPLDGFYPIFDPSDPDTILECWQVTNILPEQARALYGIETADRGTPLLKCEHWTAKEYTTTIDGKRVDIYSGINPWGVIPYVYIPRIRTIDWWGEALTDDLYSVQDELNMRIADTGEALNYHSHPVYWGRNLPSTFNTTNFPLDPSALWDLGRTHGANGETPEVGMLKNETPVPEQMFKYIDFLYDWSRVSSSAPPIAFGEDAGGGQRSGVTLEIRMWPLLKAVRRSRGYLNTGLMQALTITGRILAQKKFSDVTPGVADQLITRCVLPVFNQVMPRDEVALVDEVVKLLSTNPPAISLETAEAKLGHGIAEVEKIVKMMSMIEDWAPIEKAMKAIRSASVPQPKADKPEPSSPEADGS